MRARQKERVSYKLELFQFLSRNTKWQKQVLSVTLNSGACISTLSGKFICTKWNVKKYYVEKYLFELEVLIFYKNNLLLCL